MKKKYIAMILALSMMPSFAFANAKLTYDEAYKKAVNNNLSIERQNTSIDNIDDALESGESFKTDPAFPNPMASINSSMQYQNLLDKKQMTEKSLEAQKQAIALSIKNVFLKIQYLEKNNEMLKQKVMNKQENIDMAQVKYKYGLLSKMDFENLEIDLKELENSQKENELQIKLAYKDLNSLLNSEINQKIEYINSPYKTFASIGLSKESAVNKAVEDAPTIYEQNSQIRQLEERLKYGLLSDNYSILPKDENLKSVKIQDIDLRISKQNLKDAVIETANNIQNMEIEINNLNNQIKNMQRQATNLEKLIKFGLKTNIELKNLNLQIEDAKLQLENTIYNHNILLERYQKPYLLSLES